MAEHKTVKQMTWTNTAALIMKPKNYFQETAARCLKYPQVERTQ